jgi:hypothetical protein
MGMDAAHDTREPRHAGATIGLLSLTIGPTNDRSLVDKWPMELRQVTDRRSEREFGLRWPVGRVDAVKQAADRLAGVDPADRLREESGDRPYP